MQGALSASDVGKAFGRVRTLYHGHVNKLTLTLINFSQRYSATYSIGVNKL